MLLFETSAGIVQEPKFSVYKGEYLKNLSKECVKVQLEQGISI